MAKLKVDIRESIELNNSKYDAFNSYVVGAVNEIAKRTTKTMIIPITSVFSDILDINSSSILFFPSHFFN